LGISNSDTLQPTHCSEALLNILQAITDRADLIPIEEFRTRFVSECEIPLIRSFFDFSKKLLSRVLNETINLESTLRKATGILGSIAYIHVVLLRWNSERNFNLANLNSEKSTIRSHHSVFDEIIEQAMNLIADVQNLIAVFLSEKIFKSMRSYIRSISDLSSDEEQKFISELSHSLAEPYYQLKFSINLLITELSSDSIDAILKRTSSILDDSLFNTLSCCKFQGEKIGLQVSYDINVLASIFHNISVDHRLPKTLELCKVVSLSLSELIAIKKDLSVMCAEDKTELLIQKYRISLLTNEQFTKILRNRTDLH